MTARPFPEDDRMAVLELLESVGRVEAARQYGMTVQKLMAKCAALRIAAPYFWHKADSAAAKAMADDNVPVRDIAEAVGRSLSATTMHIQKLNARAFADEILAARAAKEEQEIEAEQREHIPDTNTAATLWAAAMNGRRFENITKAEAQAVAARAKLLKVPPSAKIRLAAVRSEYGCAAALCVERA